MSKKIVYSGQSFLDKVIENTGSIENAFEMALLNEIAITDDVAVGTEIISSSETNKAVVAFFTEDDKPATMITIAQIQEIDNIGIGSMIIETNFIVG